MDILTSITNAQLKDWLTVSAGSMGLIWYYLCIFDMGFRPTPVGEQAPGFRQFQSLSVTTISVSLATYVGYIIGLPSEATSSAKTALANAAASTAAPASVTNLQAGSAVLYVLSLLLAVYFYHRSKDNTEPAVTGLAKSLLGFVAGVFSVSLNAPA